MGILRKISDTVGITTPNYSEQEQREYMDGFRRGYPLVGQPQYPVHDSAAYRRGLRYGRTSFEKTGRPQIAYEPPVEEE
jgi:hypothetical protein